MSSLVPISQIHTPNSQDLYSQQVQPSISALEEPNIPDFQKKMEKIRKFILDGKDDAAKFELVFLIREILENSPAERSDKEKHQLIRNTLIDLRNACRLIDPKQFDDFTIELCYTAYSQTFAGRLYSYVRQPEYNLAKKYSNLYTFYFSLDIAGLKKQNDDFIICNKPVLIFNQVVTDGFGDFAIALSLSKAYLKAGITPQWMVVSAKEHIEKIQRVFQHAIQEMASQDVYIKWVVDPEGTESALSMKELAKKGDTIIVAASTGYRFFSRADRIDCLDEMHPNDIIDRSARSKTEYCKGRLSLKLGFSFDSAGVFLPEKTTYPLEQVLDSAGCLSSIQNELNKPNATLSEILEENAITIMYMKHEKAQSRYIAFMSEYAQNLGKSIHIIVPTSEQKKLAMPSEKVAPGVILHYLPLLKTEHFQAIVQQVTVPPGVTGNSSWLDAVIGEVPFFFDIGLPLVGIMQEFTDLCLNSDLDLHPATKMYLNYLHKMSTPRSQDSSVETKGIASEMFCHAEAIRSDLKKIHQHIHNNYNAEVVMCNRLRELSPEQPQKSEPLYTAPA